MGGWALSVYMYGCSIPYISLDPARNVMEESKSKVESAATNDLRGI